MLRRINPAIITFLFFGVFACASKKVVQKKIIEPPFKYSPKMQNENMVFIQSGSRKFWIDKYLVSSPDGVDFFSVAAKKPYVNVSQAQAAQLCASRGKRLCTSKEWQVACLGIHYLRYAYGKQYEKGKCNIGGYAKSLSYTGQYRECKSEYGLYDMIGNAMEITATKNDNGLAVAKGGDYSSENATCFTEFYFYKNEKNDRMGFRCCMD